MSNAEQAAHTTVLLHEAVDALVTDIDGFYVDGTFGRGGTRSRAVGQIVRPGFGAGNR